MQIIKVTIHNFCSILDGSFELHDYNLLIGANNAGKSNAMNAIRAFYEDMKYEPSKHKPLVGETDEYCWVELTFQLTSDEYAALDTTYRVEENRLRVRRILSAPQDAQKPGLYAYESAGLASRPYRGKLGRIIYIPAVSKAEDHTKTSGPSPLRDLINDVLKTITQSSEAYKRLNEAFQSFAETIKSERADNDRSLGDLEATLTESLSSWGIQFLLNISAITLEDIVKSLVSPRLIEGGKEQRIEQFGQGLQREIIFQLIRIKSEQLERSGDNSTELTMLLFEEPEAFLHPSQQAELAERLRSISGDDGSQVLISSHSPHFVSYESGNIPSIIRLHRAGGKTLFGQIPADRLDTIQTDNQKITPILLSSKKDRYHPHPDDQTVDMEAIKYFMWLDPNRCGMFFAEHVLLVEGASEVVFINYLIKQRKLKAPAGVFVLDCLGKFNFHRFIQILSEMKVDHSVLFDDDGDKDIHPQLDTLIRSFATPHTKQIQVLAGSIENALGITPTTSSHRKPQHLLYLYRTNQIDPTKLAAFIQTIEPLLSSKQSSH